MAINIQKSIYKIYTLAFVASLTKYYENITNYLGKVGFLLLIFHQFSDYFQLSVFVVLL